MEAEIVVKASGIEIIDKVEIPENSIKTSKMMNIAIAGVLGRMGSVFVIFLLRGIEH